MGDFNKTDERISQSSRPRSSCTWGRPGELDNALEMSAGVGPLGLVAGDFDEDGRLVGDGGGYFRDVSIADRKWDGNLCGSGRVSAGGGVEATWLHI